MANKLTASREGALRAAQKKAEEDVAWTGGCLKNAFVSAEEVIDSVCSKAGNHFYEKYLHPKVKPFTITMRKEQFKEMGQFMELPADYGENHHSLFGKPTHTGCKGGDRVQVFRQAFKNEDWNEDDEPKGSKVDIKVPQQIKFRRMPPGSIRVRYNKELKPERIVSPTKRKEDSEKAKSPVVIQEDQPKNLGIVRKWTQIPSLLKKKQLGGDRLVKKRMSVGNVTGFSAAGQDMSMLDPGNYMDRSELLSEKSSKKKSDRLRKVKKGFKQKLEKAKQQLNIEIPIQSSSYLERFENNSPRERQIDNMRRLKEIEARNREKNRAEESDRKKKLDQLMLKGPASSFETGESTRKKRTDRPQSSGLLRTRTGRENQSNDIMFQYTTDSIGRPIKFRKPMVPSFMQKALPNQSLGPAFKIQETIERPSTRGMPSRKGNLNIDSNRAITMKDFAEGLPLLDKDNDEKSVNLNMFSNRSSMLAGAPSNREEASQIRKRAPQSAHGANSKEMSSFRSATQNPELNRSQKYASAQGLRGLKNGKESRASIQKASTRNTTSAKTFSKPGGMAGRNASNRLFDMFGDFITQHETAAEPMIENV